MITRLHKLITGISIIQDIPTVFFREIENSVSFGNHLFPVWADVVFASTDLSAKFERVYDKYKAIKSKANRDKIIAAYDHNNKIENLCKNEAGTIAIELTTLPKTIQKEIDSLFLYLYKTAINYHLFETHVADTIQQSIDRFIRENGLGVCPFCGLEGFLNIDGQARLALDHWLSKDLFPMAAVNFNNLFPIGHDCNARPAKGSKNILLDNAVSKQRIQAFYPYLSHSGIVTSFHFTKEPTINGISDLDWSLTCVPGNPSEKDIFDSWNAIFNISIRYPDYYRKNIFPMWEADYKRFIEEDNELTHAINIEGLKANLRTWKSGFPMKGRPGAILYRTFIDYLLNNASDAYLYSLCENLRR